MYTCFARPRWACLTLAATFALTQASVAAVPERSPIQTLVPEPDEILPLGENRPQFGSAVAVRNNFALVGMATHVERGRVAVFTREGRTWRRTGQLPCPPDDCMFVNVIVMRDNVALVGGYRSILVFRNEHDGWQLKEVIQKPEPDLDNFWHGGRVRYQDGIVTAPAFGALNQPLGRPGAVFVFELDAALRVARTIRLNASDAQTGDEFGAGISMAKDTIVVGAPGARNAANEKSVGAVYVFERRDGEWAQVQKIIAPDGTLNDFLGSTVAINKGLILASATGANRSGGDSSTFERGGWVYAFRRVNGVWTQQARFWPSIQEFRRYTDFGRNIVMFGDRAIITATATPFVFLGQNIAFEYRFPVNGYRPVSYTFSISPGGIGLFNNVLIVGSPSETNISGIGQADVYDLNSPPR